MEQGEDDATAPSGAPADPSAVTDLMAEHSEFVVKSMTSWSTRRVSGQFYRFCSRSADLGSVYSDWSAHTSSATTTARAMGRRSGTVVSVPATRGWRSERRPRLRRFSSRRSNNVSDSRRARLDPGELPRIGRGTIRCVQRGRRSTRRRAAVDYEPSLQSGLPSRMTP